MPGLVEGEQFQHRRLALGRALDDLAGGKGLEVGDSLTEVCGGGEQVAVIFQDHVALYNVKRP